MPTFYSEPGIGQLDAGHIDSASFAYVKGLVNEGEWAALDTVSSDSPGLSDLRFSVHGHGEDTFTDPEGGEVSRQRSWYVSVEVASSGEGEPEFGPSMFPVRFDQLVLCPDHLPVKRGRASPPPVSPAPLLAGGAHATLTTVITPADIVMSPAFNPTTTPIVAWKAQFLRKISSCHQDQQPDTAKVEQLVANLAPAIGDQAVADGILSKTVDQAFEYIATTFKCVASAPAVMREIRTRKCTDATDVTADFTGKIMVDACNAHGHQTLEAWDATMTAAERALIYSDLASTMLTGMAPAARSAFTRNMDSLIDECVTLEKLNAVRADLNAEYTNRMKFTKKASSNIAAAGTTGPDKLLKRNQELEGQLAKQQAEIKKLKSKSKGKKGGKKFPADMSDCRHCADAPVEVEGFPGPGRHWNKLCPKAPNNQPGKGTNDDDSDDNE